MNDPSTALNLIHPLVTFTAFALAGWAVQFVFYALFWFCSPRKFIEGFGVRG